MSFLDNVPEQNVFVLSNGARIHNLEELHNVISSSEESLFYNHVNNDRNDFANWIKFVIHHEDLYNKILHVKDRRQFIDILDTEIDYIRNPKLKETAAFFSENPDAEKVSVNSQPKIEAPTQVMASVQNAVPNIVPNAVPNNSTNNSANNAVPVQTDVSNSAADMFKPVADGSTNKNPNANQNITLASSQSNNDSVDSGVVLSDFEQVLSVIIAEINNEILSWNE
jgi:hypothetical protein